MFSLDEREKSLGMNDKVCLHSHKSEMSTRNMILLYKIIFS